MTKRAWALAALTALAATSLSAQSQTPPAARPMGPVEFPAFQERPLPGGARLLVVSQDEVPFVTVNLVLRGGSAVDPADKIGAAAFLAELLTKGTPTRSADQIADAIDFLGGSLRATASTDWITVSLGVLAPDLPAGLELMADVVMHPTFPEQQLELVRTRAFSGLEASLAQPAVLASRAFLQAVYGRHPYGKLETPETIRTISRLGLQLFHESWFRPANALFVVAGAVSADQAAAALERAFQGWTPAPGPMPEIVYGMPPAPQSTRVVLVHQPGTVQATVRAGHLLPKANAPDWTALAVANQVLGGGSAGRLFRVLREEKGWTYGAYSSATRRPDLGVWQATLDARTEVAADAIAEMLAQIGRMRTEMVSSAELDVTKSFLVGSFPLQIETPEQIASQVLNNRLLGLPDDALRTYRDRVAALDAPDLRQASTEYLHLDRMVIVVAGDAVLLADRLERFGPVTVLDVDGRPLDTAVLLATPSGERFDASVLRPGAFEYRVMLQGSEVGTMKRELVPDTTGGRAMAFRGTITLGPQTIDQEVVFGVPDFDARSARMSMNMAGQTAHMEARVQGGRLVGTVILPTGSQPVDREVPAGTLIADMVEMAVWIADLSPGKEIRVAVARLETGGVETQVMRVQAVEEVTVPAGTFQAYRVQIAGSEPQTVWARVEAPHVILKLEPTGQPLTLELVSLPPG